MRFHDFAFPNELLLGESYCVDEMMCVFLSERERERETQKLNNVNLKFKICLTSFEKCKFAHGQFKKRNNCACRYDFSLTSYAHLLDLESTTSSFIKNL
jgi:hypothetical protein